MIKFSLIIEFNCHHHFTVLVDPATQKPITHKNGSQGYWKGRLCDIDPINSCDDDPCKGNPGTDYTALYGHTPAGTCMDLVSG